MSFGFLEKVNMNEIIAASLALFAVIDPLGSISIYLKFKKKIGVFKPFKITFFVTVISLIFLFTGQYILQGFDISAKDFVVAGALILAILGLEMVLNIEIFRLDTDSIKSALLTPLAFPIIVGPGTLTTLITLQADYQMVNILIALCINILLLLIVLYYIVPIEQKLAQFDLINILHKVMGIILLAMAIKLFKLHLFT